MTNPTSSEPTNQLQPENYTTRLQVRPAAWPAVLVLLVVVGIGVAGYMFLTGQIALRPHPDSPEGKILAQKETAQRNVEFAHRADSALNTVTWDTAQQKLLDAQNFHRALLEAQSKLNADLKRLGEGTEGKRIATRDTWVDQFITVRDHERLSDEDVAAQLRTIQTLLPVCQQALKEKIVLPCDDRFLAQADSTHRALSKAAQEVEDDLKSLQVLIASAQAAQPADKTLAAAASARIESQRLQSLATLTQERDRQRQELEKAARERELATERTLQETKLAAEQKVREADLAREKAEQDRRVLEAKAQSERAQHDLKQAEDQRQREKARRERVAKFEAALPGLKPLLSPFISSGKMQLIPGKGWREAEPGPMSLAVLQSTGAIKDEPGTHLVLMNLSPAPGSLNDRPMGSFPIWRVGAELETEREVRRVQTFIREYGDLLVERGMLLP